MWLDREFMDVVEDLYVPAMGTDTMAPMLYSLIRFTRARTVLEAGMGYTTPFLAKALHDNDVCFRAERAALIEKTVTYLDDIDAMGPAGRIAENGPERRALGAIYEDKSSQLGNRRTEWMFANPGSLLRPGFYLEEPPAQLCCVDNGVAESSSAKSVSPKLAQLGLTDYVSTYDDEFWSIDFTSAAAHHLPFDVIWVDLPITVMNVLSLLRGPHWELLNPDGGLLVIHDMLTHEGGQMLVKEFFKADQQKRFDDFEFFGLIEPQRAVQNSFVMIRKLTKHVDQRYEKYFTAAGDSTFEADARALLASWRSSRAPQ